MDMRMKLHKLDILSQIFGFTMDVYRLAMHSSES